MFEQFQNHINTNFPFLKKEKFLLAVSGGIDSMVLINLCHQLQLDFAVAHCNFQLRGTESDDDENYVKSHTEKLQIPIYIQKFNTEALSKQQKLSIQVTARNLRYDWFYSLLSNHNFDYILTAHHLDDSLETFLINFTRGSGIDGLTGIPERNDKIIRPLLPFSRSEIETFAKEINIQWREDSSNASDKYLRNKLRHELVPILKDLNPSFLATFQNTISSLQQSQSLVNDATQMVYKEVVSEEDTIKIDIAKLLNYPNYKAYLYQWLQSYGFTSWIDIYDLLKAQSGKQVFSDKYIVLKDRNHLIVFPKQKENEDATFWINKEDKDVKIPLKISFCNVDDISVVPTNTIFVDEDKLQFPLTIRRWQEGEVFYPYGMNGKKKLSKFFKDEKYSLLDKSNAWLLCSDNQIVWVINKRQDSRFLKDHDTKKILQIKTE
jgi:tRNA(Ile)-lysidine synthase